MENNNNYSNIINNKSKLTSSTAPQYTKEGYLKKSQELLDTLKNGYGHNDLSRLNDQSNQDENKDQGLTMSKTPISDNPWDSDEQEIAVALGVAKNNQDQVEAKSNKTTTTKAKRHIKDATTSYVSELTDDNNLKDSSDVNKQRIDRSLEIMGDLGPVLNEYVYKKYRLKMENYSLEPCSQDLLLAMMVYSFFSKDGVLSQQLANYNPRRGQIEFADSVARAMAKHETLVVEAGTGTGKTFSYLVPPLLAGKKIMVSTKTKALQDQLISKDIPNLLSMMGLEDINAIALKGQSNYICRYLLEGSGMEHIEQRLLERLVKYNNESSDSMNHNIRTASFGEIKFKIPEQFRHFAICDYKLCREMSPTCPYSELIREHLKKATEIFEACKKDITSSSDENIDDKVNDLLRHLENTRIPDMTGDHCYYFASRQEAKKRDITVINHALFFAGMVSENGIGSISSSLPLPDILIFDEAHTLADVGREFFSSEFSAPMLIDLIKNINNVFKHCIRSGSFKKQLEKLGQTAHILNLGLSLLPEGRHNVTAVKYLHYKRPSPFQLLKYRLADYRTEIALLNDSYYMSVVNKDLQADGAKLFGKEAYEQEQEAKQKAKELAKGNKLIDLEDEVTSKVDDAEGLMGLSEEEEKKEQRRTTRENLAKDSTLQKYVKLEYQRLALEHQKKLGIYYSRNDKYVEAPDIILDNQGMPVIDQYFRSLMIDMHKALGEIYKLVERNKELIKEEEKEQVNIISEQILEYRNFITDFMTTDRNKKHEECFDNAGWFEKDKADSDTRLVVCPIDIGDQFSDAIFKLKQRGVTVLFTSATITVDKNFNKFCNELGLNMSNVTTKIVESPFDYAKNACLYLSGLFPKVESTTFIQDSLVMVDDLIKQATGGIFILCTSYMNMKLAHEVLEDKYGRQRSIFIQGEAPVPELLRNFKDDGRAILIGTASFWEGVDVPGNALSLVIIDKIPFKQINDPMQLARKNRIEKLLKGNFFAQVQVPEAIIALRQGAGRLIRNEDDQGVLVILDNRLVSNEKSYARPCVNSLPPMTRVATIDEAIKYFKKID